MRFSGERLDRYGLALATRLDAIGADLDAGSPALAEADDGRISLAISASLPGSPSSARARIELVEHWAVDGSAYQLIGYRYELIDHENDRRRAFHRHDDALFIRAFDVVVHEHCEEPIGVVRCAHGAGLPKRDGFEALNDLLSAWSTPPAAAICAGLPCLD